MSESLYSSGTNMARTISFFRAHKRVSVIIFSWVAFCAFVLIPKWRNEPFAFVFFSALFVTLISSQLFWIPRLIGLGERFILGKRQRVWVKVIVGVLYLFFFVCHFGPWNIPRGIGTTGPPIRLGPRPEITVLELFRA